MEAQTLNPAEAGQVALVQKRLALEAGIRSGVNWFFWVAGLSIINTVIYIAGGSISFIFGLGATQVVDAVTNIFAKGLSTNASTLLHVIGFGIDLLIAGIFVAAGLLGQKRHLWAVILGMLLYALDGVVFIFVEDWLAAVFHLWVLFGIWRGLSAINQLKKLEASVPAAYPGAPVAYPTAPGGYSDSPAVYATVPPAYSGPSAVESDLDKPRWAQAGSKRIFRIGFLAFIGFLGLGLVAVVIMVLAN